MATLWIREYARGMTGSDNGRLVPLVAEPGTDQTPVTFSTSAQSAAFATSTSVIGIIGSAAFHFVIAADPTATTNALKIPADTLVHMVVTPGHKIAAIAAA